MRKPPSPSASRIGVEHEYQIFDATGSVDARALLPSLSIDGRRLDPADQHAIRCRWGGVITADGREAEVATPPVALAETAVRRTVALAATGRATLLDALPPAHRLRGYSTHLNVGMPDRDVVAVSRLVVERMAPALMLVLDRTDAPGIVIRPRFARLEVGGEHCTGARLRAALTLTTAVAMFTHRALRDRALRTRLPAPLEQRVVPSPQRYGWFVDRRATGIDLYAAGRAALLTTSAGTIRAGDLLERTWVVAREAIMGVIAADDIDAVDRLVAGAEPLPQVWSPLPDDGARDADGSSCGIEPWPTPLVDGWLCAGIEVDVASATWHRVLLRARTGDQVRWISVAGERIDAVAAALASGALDAWLVEQFGPRGRRRRAARDVRSVSRGRSGA